MASDFIKVLQEIRGTELPEVAYTDGIYWNLTIALHNGNPGIYGGGEDFQADYLNFLTKYNDFVPKYDDFIVKYTDFLIKYADVLVKHTEAVEAASAASTSETNAADSEAVVVAKEALMSPHYDAIDAVAAIDTDVTAVSVIDTDVTTVAAIDTDVTIAATNVADITNFADVYQGGKASDPTTRNDSSALQEGDLYYSTTDNHLYTYNGASWDPGYTGDVYSQAYIDAQLALQETIVDNDIKLETKLTVKNDQSDTLTITDTDYTLTADENLYGRIELNSSVLTAPIDLIVNNTEHTFLAVNNEVEDYTVKTSVGTGILVPVGKSKKLRNDGTNVIEYEAYQTLLEGLLSTKQMFILEDQKTSGAHGGGFTSGAWQDRDMTTSLMNTISGASFDSGLKTFTLPAGDYIIFAFALATAVGGHIAKIKNITDTIEYLGSSGYNNSADSYTNGRSDIQTPRFIIAGTKTFKLQHICETTKATNGFGRATALAVEVYSRIIIVKVG